MGRKIELQLSIKGTSPEQIKKHMLDAFNWFEIKYKLGEELNGRTEDYKFNTVVLARSIRNGKE